MRMPICRHAIDALRGGRALAHRGTKERVREAARQIRAIADIGEDDDEASIGLLVALAWPDRIGAKARRTRAVSHDGRRRRGLAGA